MSEGKELDEIAQEYLLSTQYNQEEESEDFKEERKQAPWSVRRRVPRSKEFNLLDRASEGKATPRWKDPFPSKNQSQEEPPKSTRWSSNPFGESANLTAADQNSSRGTAWQRGPFEELPLVQEEAHCDVAFEDEEEKKVEVKQIPTMSRTRSTLFASEREQLGRVEKENFCPNDYPASHAGAKHG